MEHITHKVHTYAQPRAQLKYTWIHDTESMHAAHGASTTCA